MSDLLDYKGYSGSIEYSATDNVLHGKVLGVRSLLSYEGNSLDSLRSDFEDIIDDYLETCAEDGIEPEKPYKGKFNVRVSPELHRLLAVYAIANGQTLNATVEEAIKRHVLSGAEHYALCIMNYALLKTRPRASRRVLNFYTVLYILTYFRRHRALLTKFNSMTTGKKSEWRFQ